MQDASSSSAFIGMMSTVVQRLAVWCRMWRAVQRLVGWCRMSRVVQRLAEWCRSRRDPAL